jgi:hypothetical protein
VASCGRRGDELVDLLGREEIKARGVIGLAQAFDTRGGIGGEIMVIDGVLKDRV